MEAVDPIRLAQRGAFCPEGLLLLPGGRLVRRRFGSAPVHRDVTDTAYEFLFEYLFFYEGATLRRCCSSTAPATTAAARL